jgi:hypothetical protein
LDQFYWGGGDWDCIIDFMDDTQTKPFFVAVYVQFYQPLAFDQSPDKQTLHAYFINYGVRAKDRKGAMQIVAEAIGDGKVDWTKSEWSEIPSLDPAIARNATAIIGAGVWYKSGRCFFKSDTS